MITFREALHMDPTGCLHAGLCLQFTTENLQILNLVTRYAPDQTTCEKLFQNNSSTNLESQLNFAY